MSQRDCWAVTKELPNEEMILGILRRFQRDGKTEHHVKFVDTTNIVFDRYSHFVKMHFLNEDLYVREEADTTFKKYLEKNDYTVTEENEIGYFINPNGKFTNIHFTENGKVPYFDIFQVAHLPQKLNSARKSNILTEQLHISPAGPNLEYEFKNPFGKTYCWPYSFIIDDKWYDALSALDFIKETPSIILLDKLYLIWQITGLGLWNSIPDDHWITAVWLNY